MSGTATAERLVFANRCAAGRALAARLAPYRSQAPVVLGLPRGGVPVAYEVAHALDAPLGILAVRKIPAPGRPALVIGAVAPGASYVDEETAALLDVAREYLDASLARERRIAEWMSERLQQDAVRPDVRGRTAIVVDDGIITGATALVAIELVRAEQATRVVVGAPVCAVGAYERVHARADDLVCITQVEDTSLLATSYVDFTPVSDAEIRRLLKLARLERETGFHYVGAAS